MWTDTASVGERSEHDGKPYVEYIEYAGTHEPHDICKLRSVTKCYVDMISKIDVIHVVEFWYILKCLLVNSIVNLRQYFIILSLWRIIEMIISLLR
jgi:hypothetical protein